jgi:hypothetical protein
MRRRPHLSALLTPVILAACLDPEPLPESNYGIVGLTTIVTATDTIVSPEALFYRTGPLVLPTSRVSGDQCQLATYPTPSQGSERPRFLDAGDSVALSTTTATTHLFRTVDANGESYILRDDDRFPFHPGERITITVPGVPGGFANGTVSVLTARGFTLGPIDPSPPPDEPLDLTWSPAGDDSTKMLVSLQYGVGQVEANQQIFCSLRDDGVFEIPAVLVVPWRNAVTGSRKFEAARWRVAETQVTGGFLLAISAFAIEDVVD